MMYWIERPAGLGQAPDDDFFARLLALIVKREEKEEEAQTIQREYAAQEHMRMVREMMDIERYIRFQEKQEEAEERARTRAFLLAQEKQEAELEIMRKKEEQELVLAAEHARSKARAHKKRASAKKLQSLGPVGMIVSAVRG